MLTWADGNQPEPEVRAREYALWVDAVNTLSRIALRSEHMADIRSTYSYTLHLLLRQPLAPLTIGRTARMLEIDVYPVFSIFDHVTPYNGVELKPYTLYMVRATKQTSRCRYGFLLQEARAAGMEFEILAQCEPHRVKRVPLKKSIAN